MPPSAADGLEDLVGAPRLSRASCRWPPSSSLRRRAMASCARATVSSGFSLSAIASRPWGLTAAQGGVCLARSPVTASHKSRAPGHVSGPVAARSRPPRRPRSQMSRSARQNSRALRRNPPFPQEKHKFSPNKVVSFCIFLLEIPFSSSEESAVAVRKSCAAPFPSPPPTCAHCPVPRPPAWACLEKQRRRRAAEEWPTPC